MLMERNTLMEYVYPKIKEYCREKHGLEFQVNELAMDWGQGYGTERLWLEVLMSEALLGVKPVLGDSTPQVFYVP